MRTLIILCGLAATAFFAWQYPKMNEEKTAAQSRLDEATKQLSEREREISTARNELEAINARIAALSRVPRPPVSKPNWVDQRNSNWNSPLTGRAQ